MTVATVPHVGTLAEDYRVFDDPVSGERWVRYPTGDWLVVDRDRLREFADSDDPAVRVLVSYLSG